MSDSNKQRSRHLVIGTAGHIDHGKTSLVRALTGVDTDRLAEEKRRGISIDLGFAHAAASDEVMLSFVDVPGHEDFVKNMLAGVSGVRAAMLVVAANEGVMPQTREHFEICRLMGVETGVIALSKSDLATGEQTRAVRNQVAALCRGSFLDGKPAIAVSARSGAGLNELRGALEALSFELHEEAASEIARLPVDRSFALKGFGTIVTGTLLRGQIALGDTVMIQPGAMKARVRGLRAAGQTVERAIAGQRVAVNLAGIDHSGIARGCVLTNEELVAPTTSLGVRVEWLDYGDAPTRKEEFLFHAGTAEIPARVKMLNAGEPFARIELSRPALLFPHDRFVLRRPSPQRTVGGGAVIETFPPVRLQRRKMSARLEALETSFAPLVGKGTTLDALLRKTGLTKEHLSAAIAKDAALLALDEASGVYRASWVGEQEARVLAFLADFHKKHPDVAGAPLAQARLNLEPALARAILMHSRMVTLTGDTVALASHRAQVSDDKSRALRQMEQAFRAAGFQPPAPAAVLASSGAKPLEARSLIETLIKSNRLIRIGNDLVFHADVVQHIQASLAAHKGRRFSVPEFKEWTHISRKYAIPLLEYLDRQRVTRRDGDFRIVL